MDLNKDNKNIYTVDAESYAEYMHENEEKPTNILNSSIKILLLILLLVLTYFFYKILKDDLSFSQVFNKKELVSTYALLKSDDTSKDTYVEVLAKDVSTDTVKAKKVEKEKVETIKKVETTKIIEPIKKTVEDKKVEEVKVVVKKEVVAESATIDIATPAISTPRNVSKTTVLNESYVDRMLKEMNSN